MLQYSRGVNLDLEPRLTHATSWVLARMRIKTTFEDEWNCALYACYIWKCIKWSRFYWTSTPVKCPFPINAKLCNQQYVKKKQLFRVRKYTQATETSACDVAVIRQCVISRPWAIFTANNWAPLNSDWNVTICRRKHSQIPRQEKIKAREWIPPYSLIPKVILSSYFQTWYPVLTRIDVTRALRGCFFGRYVYVSFQSEWRPPTLWVSLQFDHDLLLTKRKLQLLDWGRYSPCMYHLLSFFFLYSFTYHFLTIQTSRF